jgi:hypothetical protein
MAVHDVAEPEITGCVLKPMFLVSPKNIYLTACNAICFFVYAVFCLPVEDDDYFDIIMGMRRESGHKIVDIYLAEISFSGKMGFG